MKLKLDENLPVSLRARLEVLGFDVDTVLDEKLGGQSDDVVWSAAQGEDRLLVTQDLDFSDLRRFVPGTHAGILLARLPQSQQARAGDLIVACFSMPEARTWSRCLVVVTPSRVRVSRPATPANDDGDDDGH